MKKMSPIFIQPHTQELEQSWLLHPPTFEPRNKNNEPQDKQKKLKTQEEEPKAKQKQTQQKLILSELTVTDSDSRNKALKTSLILQIMM